jgi:hypothetical protein
MRLGTGSYCTTPADHLTDLPSPCRVLRRALHSAHRNDATPGRTPGRVAGASPASASGGLPQALACRLDGVLAWARPAGGAGRGDPPREVERRRWFALPTCSFELALSVQSQLNQIGGTENVDLGDQQNS